MKPLWTLSTCSTVQRNVFIHALYHPETQRIVGSYEVPGSMLCPLTAFPCVILMLHNAWSDCRFNQPLCLSSARTVKFSWDTEWKWRHSCARHKNAWLSTRRYASKYPRVLTTLSIFGPSYSPREDKIGQ